MTIDGHSGNQCFSIIVAGLINGLNGFPPGVGIPYVAGSFFRKKKQDDIRNQRQDTTDKNHTPNDLPILRAYNALINGGASRMAISGGSKSISGIGRNQPV